MMSHKSPAPKISVVVPALNEASYLHRTIDNLQATLPDSSEIIVVDDGSSDGCSDFLAAAEEPLRLVRSNRLGVAKARNFGAGHSRGDVIIFADAHLALPARWWEPMLEMLQNPSVGAVAPAVTDMENPNGKGFGWHFGGPDLHSEWLEQQGDAPYPVPLLPGMCMAVRRDVFEVTGGFDSGLIRWGSTENEMSLRLWLSGYELWLVPQIEVAHLFRETPPYEVEAPAPLHNKLRLACLHFETQRLIRVMTALREQEEFPEALALVVASDVSSRRRELATRRVHDSEWYFQKFGPNW